MRSCLPESIERVDILVGPFSRPSPATFPDSAENLVFRLFADDHVSAHAPRLTFFRHPKSYWRRSVKVVSTVHRGTQALRGRNYACKKQNNYSHIECANDMNRTHADMPIRERYAEKMLSYGQGLARLVATPLSNRDDRDCLGFPLASMLLYFDPRVVYTELFVALADLR